MRITTLVAGMLVVVTLGMGCASKSDVQNLSEEVRQARAESSGVREDLNRVQAEIQSLQEQTARAQEASAIAAREQMRLRDEMAALDAAVKPLRDVPQLIVTLERLVEKTTDAFVRSLKLQEAAARAQADKIAELVAEIGEGKAPGEEDVAP